MKQMDSEITGLVSQAQKAASSAGRELGATESGKSPIASESARREWLLAHTPAETDRGLASLISSLSVTLEETSELRFPPSGGYYHHVTSRWTTGTAGDRMTARNRVAAACIPARDDQIEEWLAVLQIATAGAKKSDSTQAATLRLYTNALKRYPADIAQAACIQLAETCKWFPVLSDVLELCDDMYETRRNWLKRLEA